MKTQHTLGPLHVQPADLITDGGDIPICDESGFRVAWVNQFAVDNSNPGLAQHYARQIVRAVNSHAELLAALRELTESIAAYIDIDQVINADIVGPYEQARAAIAKATEGEG